MLEEPTKEAIKGIVHDVDITAKNVKTDSFEGMEIHASNGYLIAGFLSFFQNKRTEEYSGCFQNRCRFLKEVYDKVCKNVGPDFPIIVRFSAVVDSVDGGGIAESCMLAKTLEGWVIDAINCSNGVYGSYNRAQVSTLYAACLDLQVCRRAQGGRPHPGHIFQ